MTPIREVNLTFLCVLFLLCRSTAAPPGPAPADSTHSSLISFPDRLFTAIIKKSYSCQNKLQTTTAAYLDRLERHEKKLKRKLAARDSSAAQRIFGNIDSTYSALGARLDSSHRNGPTQSNHYVGHLDSLQTATRYLELSSGSTPQMQAAVSSCQQLQSQLNATQDIQQTLQQRQQNLSAQLKPYSLDAALDPLRKQLYYYKAQVDAYTETFTDPSKLEAGLLSTLRQLPSFQSFFNRYSQLGSLFSLPGNNGTTPDISGLPTRDIVTQDLEQKMGSASAMQQTVQQGMTEGQGELQNLQNKLGGLGSGSAASGGNMPGFTPNDQKKKSIWKRLEIGTTIQSTKAYSIFPITTDLGLTLAYKLNDKCKVGVGASANLGWGSDVRHMSLSYQGETMRSFVDFRIKGDFWLTGGLELDYLNVAHDFQKIYSGIQDWQKNALFGITREIRAGKIKSSISLLYNALWNQQLPNTQPFSFRIGYSL